MKGGCKRTFSLLTDWGFVRGFNPWHPSSSSSLTCSKKPWMKGAFSLGLWEVLRALTTLPCVPPFPAGLQWHLSNNCSATWERKHLKKVQLSLLAQISGWRGGGASLLYLICVCSCISQGFAQLEACSVLILSKLHEKHLEKAFPCPINFLCLKKKIIK